MSETNRPSNEIDDYIATFSPEERKEYRAAETALDLASMLYHIRHTQGLTQRSAAERSGLKQPGTSHQSPGTSSLQYAARHPPTLSRCIGISSRDQRDRRSYVQRCR